MIINGKEANNNLVKLVYGLNIYLNPTMKPCCFVLKYELYTIVYNLNKLR